ncbi:response regulator transcription factor [Actinacidiphila sp. bgisy167]|uniref:response regulator transcription factor n=1 Tax=Actinacidiphila sp. bgisy167 TaxID=3413797 RepID=UPI003D75B5AB
MSAAATTPRTGAATGPDATAATTAAGLPDLAPASVRPAAGRTCRRTARHLGLSKHTVDAGLRRIRAKLGISGTAELTRTAVALGP